MHKIVLRQTLYTTRISRLLHARWNYLYQWSKDYLMRLHNLLPSP